jgi:hypothetical protein
LPSNRLIVEMKHDYCHRFWVGSIGILASNYRLSRSSTGRLEGLGAQIVPDDEATPQCTVDCTNLSDLENDNTPNGYFSVDENEARAYWGYVSEQISLTNLASGVRLVRCNCIN